MTCPTEVLALSITGASAVTATTSVRLLTPSCTLTTTVRATSRRMSFSSRGWNPVSRVSSWYVPTGSAAI